MGDCLKKHSNTTDIQLSPHNKPVYTYNCYLDSCTLYYGPTNTFRLRICLCLRLFLAPLLGESAPGNLGQANLDFSSTKVKKPQSSVNLGTLGRNFGQKAWAKREEESKTQPTVEVKREVDVDLTSSDEETLAVSLLSFVSTYWDWHSKHLCLDLYKGNEVLYTNSKNKFGKTQALLVRDVRASYWCK